MTSFRSFAKFKLISRNWKFIASFLAVALSLPAWCGTPVFLPTPTGFPTAIPVGKTLVIPIACDNSDASPVSFTVTSSNPKIFARIRTGNPHLKMHVKTDNDGSGSSYEGDMEFQLFRNLTPETASFIGGYAQSGYYDNVLFHRIVPTFVLQGGDPAGTGTGTTSGGQNLNLNYSLPHEFRPELIFTGRGQLAMANSDGGYSLHDANGFLLPAAFPDYGQPNYRTGNFQATNGTQFFITLGQPRNPPFNLDFKHTIFGQLTRGFDVMDRFAAVPQSAANNKPTVDVKMTALSVAPSKRDAILLLSAVGSTPTGQPATITVTANGGSTATKTIQVTAFKDTVNDPPILFPLEPVNMPLRGVPVFIARTADLESDVATTRFPVLEVSSGQAFVADISPANLQIVGRPTPGPWDLTLGVEQLNDPASGGDPFANSRFQVLEVGVGGKNLVAKPITLEATEGVDLVGQTVAIFRHAGSGSAAADFTATVNWGDGSNLDPHTGPPATTVQVIRSKTQAGAFDVRASHKYARHGVYPLKVNIDGPSGETATAIGAAVVHAAGATLRAVGREVNSARATLSKRPLATFSDATPGTTAKSYRAIVDWGDGQRGSGTVLKIGFGKFVVLGSHTYLDAETFPVSVHIDRIAPSAESAVAWSMVKLRGFTGPVHLPPFANANITATWPVDFRKIPNGSLTDLSGAIFVQNGGRTATKPWKLRFWLSNDAVLGGDTLLKMGPSGREIPEINLGPLGPGFGGTLSLNGNFALHLPSGNGTDKYVIAELLYNDPLTDLLPVPKTIVYGPIRPGIIVSTASITVGEANTPSASRTAQFRVRLDSPPTGAATITLAANASQNISTATNISFGGGTTGNVSVTSSSTTSKSVTVASVPAGLVAGSSLLGSTVASIVVGVVIPLEIQNAAGSVDNTRATLDKSSLTFTAANYNADQFVTVTAIDDAIRNGNVSFAIRLKPATSADPRFSNLDGDDILLTVIDND
jgi:cyclophilin family peptidyl-prolyl cis-trans isomerase